MSRNVTLALPDDLAQLMDRYPHIRWSEVARRAIREEISRMQVYDRLFADSRLTEEDAVELGKEIDRDVARRTREEIEALKSRKNRKRGEEAGAS